MKTEDLKRLLIALGYAVNIRRIATRTLSRLFVTVSLFALSFIFGVTALGFCTLTAYLLLLPEMGQIGAALVIAAALAALAYILWIFARRSGRYWNA